jgi:hypothetical protein
MKLLLSVLLLATTSQAQWLQGISASGITPTSATVNWSTCAMAGSSVSYGPTTAYGNIAGVPGMTSAHSVPLTGLSPNQLYHYVVTSVDSTGAIVTSVDQTFTTPSTSPPPPPPATFAIDKIAFKNATTRSTNLAAPAFSTAAVNELLLAFIATDSSSTGTSTITKVTGGGLVWSLVKRANGQPGDAEVWQAFSPTVLTNVAVTGTLSQSNSGSITVLSFLGASSTVGASTSTGAASGAPTGSLVTTNNGSWVFGVGLDWATATARTLGPNQTMVNQYLSTVNGTFTAWVQRQNLVTPSSGTTVTINDTAPSEVYDLVVVEVTPATPQTAPPPPPPPPPPPSSQTATLISHGDSIVVGQAEFGNAPGNQVSLSTTSAIGDLTIIAAWCDDDQTFEAVDGGCTPVSLTYGSNPTPVQTSVAMAKSPADPVTNDAGTGQGFIYYVLSNTAANQTITFTGAEVRQYQVAYMTFHPGTGYTFAHNSSMDSLLGSGQSGMANLPSYVLTPANAPAVVIDFTACSSHCMSPIGAAWTTLTWGTGFQELQESENLFAYAGSMAAGTYVNSVSVLNGGTAKWQGIISSFQLEVKP